MSKTRRRVIILLSLVALILIGLKVLCEHLGFLG